MAPPPAYSTLRFLPSIGKPPDKKRNAGRACDQCRRRKKRCFHLENGPPRRVSAGADEESRAAQPQDALPNAIMGSPATFSAANPGRGPASSTDTQSPSQQNARFLSVLNPESALISATSAEKAPTNSDGIWHGETSSAFEERSMFMAASLFYSVPDSKQRTLAPLLEDQSLGVRPPQESYLALEAFYVNNIHPILPCVSLTRYRDSPGHSPVRILQEQTICLLASTNAGVRSHLRLSDDELRLEPAEFACKLVGSMRLSIELAIVSDRFVVIQALTAMSLMTYGRESTELAPQFFSRAACHALTSGVHQPSEETRDELVSDLFCYMWSVDRLHAAMQGRPTMMHAVDMAKDPLDCAKNQQPGFRVFVYIATLLDKVIALYRPRASFTEIPDDQFPSYEEILAECGALQLPAHFQATLELFYHFVSILSCRQGPNISIKTRNTRQAASALQILSIMDDDNAGNLIMLPFVPHAVSLSLSTAYRDWRHSQVATYRSRARKQLIRSYEHLLPLRTISWSAKFMAELAFKVLQDTQDEDVDNLRNSGPASSKPLENAEAIGDTNPTHAEQQAGTFSQPYSDLMNVEWNLDDLDSILEANLDPQSIPWWFQDPIT